MTQTFGRLLCAAASAGALAIPAAHADTAVIDFEPAALQGLYMPGDTFAQGGYTLRTSRDYGIVDTAAGLGGNAPTGNATQFYFNSNDGALSIARTDTALFSLNGFAAAFVPLDPASSQTTVLVALGTKQDNSTVNASWSFASAVASLYPFATYATYNSASSFATFTNLKSVQFYACSRVGSTICSQPTMNNGQFAIDNIVLTTPVPEPATAVLAALGLLGLGLRARRNLR